MAENQLEQLLCSTLTLILRSFVDDASAVRVTFAASSGKATLIQVRVAVGDVGHVIGKNGRMADALRQYIRAFAENQGGKYRFFVGAGAEDERSMIDTPQVCHSCCTADSAL